MPPRKRKSPLALRAQLEADLASLELVDHAALIELARLLADDLDLPRAHCSECYRPPGPDPRIVQRYLDALEALGIGSIPPKPERDTFREMLEDFVRGPA